VKPAEKDLKKRGGKTKPVFFAPARRGRPLADTSPARVVRNAPSSKNPGAYFAGKTPRFSKSFSAHPRPADGKPLNLEP
jgi:hypothetical protein